MNPTPHPSFTSMPKEILLFKGDAQKIGNDPIHNTGTEGDELARLARKATPKPTGRRSALYRNPEALFAAMRVAASAHLRGATWSESARLSDIPLETIRGWEKAPGRRNSKVWHATKREIAIELGFDTPSLDREGAIREKVDTEGVSTPEELCDRYSLDAARIQVETMLDLAAPRRERLDAAHKVLALGGHSPVNKSVTISAPVTDPNVLKQIIGALEGVKQIRSEAPALMVEFTSDPTDEGL